MYSLKFKNSYINDVSTIVGPNEKKGNIIKNIKSIEDFYDCEKSFEKCQIKMVKSTIDDLIENNKLMDQDIDLIIGGDLTNQITASTYAIKDFDISFLGIYSACSTFTEGLIISALFLENNQNLKIINTTSNHNLVCERQFRYPVEYGCLRNENSTFTSTCAISCLISSSKSNIKICDATISSIQDLGISDPNDIGAIMAPAVAETIVAHLNNFNRKIEYYDLILTGDLGGVGVSILKEYLKKEFNINYRNILDAGNSLYKNIDDINDGASGPATLPLYLFYNIIKKNKYKKILVVGSGSLHSSTMVNQKISIPSIAHAVSLEVLL